MVVLGGPEFHQLEVLKNRVKDFAGGRGDKNLPAHAGDTVQSLVWQDFTCFRATKLRDHNH